MDWDDLESSPEVPLRIVTVPLPLPMVGEPSSSRRPSQSGREWSGSSAGRSSHQPSRGNLHENRAHSPPTDRRCSEERRGPSRHSDPSHRSPGHDFTSRPSSGDLPHRRSRSLGRRSLREDRPALRAPPALRAQEGGRMSTHIVFGPRSLGAVARLRSRSPPHPWEARGQRPPRARPPQPPSGLVWSRRGKFSHVVFRLAVVPLGLFRTFCVFVELISAFLS